MRTTIYAILVMFLVACTEEATESSLIEGDGGPLATDSEVQSTDTQPTNDSEKDSEEVDSDVKDSETQDSDKPDTDTSDTEDSDTGDPEPEPCVFSEKGDWKCEGNVTYQCKEDPNSSIVELIWLYQNDCPVGTQCEIANHPTGDYAICEQIGECLVGQIQCNENNAQVLECILDDETGGGVWEVQDKCVAQGLKCWPYGSEAKCVSTDWVYCGWQVEPGDFDCVENYIVECSEDYHWEVVHNCSDANLTCGEDNGDFICYDKCDYTCSVNRSMCEQFNGTVVYKSGECLNDQVCCKPFNA